MNENRLAELVERAFHHAYEADADDIATCLDEIGTSGAPFDMYKPWCGFAKIDRTAATVLNDHSADASGMLRGNDDEWIKVASVWKPRRKSGDA